MQTLAALGVVLVAQNKMPAANEVFTEIDAAIAQWPAERRELYQHGESRILALYAAGKFDEGIAAAQDRVKRLSASLGAGAFDVASTQGLLGIGYARAGRDAEAIAAFKAAIPVLTTESREAADTDDPALVAGRGARVRRAVEAYIAVLARSGGADVAAQTFALADLVRGHVVDRSLADSSARLAAKDPALASWRETSKTSPSSSTPSSACSTTCCRLPADQRDEKLLSGVNAEIAKLRAQAAAAKSEIDRRFPAYANLTQAPVRRRSPPSRRRSGRTKRCCRSISAATPASSGRSRRPAPSPSRQSR